MGTFILQNDEVILYEGIVSCKPYKGSLILTLTSQNLVFEQEKGVFKKQRELVETIQLESVKIYNDIVQVKQKSDTVEVQTVERNLTVVFSGIIEARKFTAKIMDTISGKSLAKRSSEKIANAISMVDETLGIDTRGTVRGIVEQGVKGVIINGISKKR